MKHIGFIMHRFACGGAEQVTITLANELAKKNYRVTFLVKFDDGEFKVKLNKDVQVISLSSNKKKAPDFIRFLKREYESNKFDCVFSVSLGMSTFAVLVNILSKTNVKLIPVIHSSMTMADTRFKKVKFFVMRHFDNFTYRTVVISNKAKEEYLKCTHVPSNKVVTIYNPVVTADLKEKMLQNPTHKWLVNKDSPVIIAVGRLIISKNYKFMLEVLKEVLNYRTVRLIILGTGELLEELIQYAEKLYISEYVDFRGFEENPYTYYGNADCFLMTSDYEGLPTVMIEALACGCPVVSTDCISGPSEILKEGKYGYLTRIGDKESIVHALLKTIDDNDINKERLKRRADYFSVDNSVAEYIKLIEGISNGC